MQVLSVLLKVTCLTTVNQKSIIHFIFSVFTLRRENEISLYIKNIS